MALFGRQLSLTGNQQPAPRGRIATFESSDTESPPPPKRAFDFDNVLKLIPSEIIAPFITAVGLPVTSVFGYSWRHIVFFTCLLASVLLRAQASKPVGAPYGAKGVNWPLVGVSAFAFFLWAHAVDDHGPLVDRSAFGGLPSAMSPTAIWGFFAVIFGLLAPMLVPDDSKSAR